MEKIISRTSKGNETNEVYVDNILGTMGYQMNNSNHKGNRGNTSKTSYRDKINHINYEKADRRRQKLIYLLKNPIISSIVNTNKKYGIHAKLSRIINSFQLYMIEPEVFMEEKKLGFRKHSVDVIMLSSGWNTAVDMKNYIDFLNLNLEDAKLIADELKRLTHTNSYVIFTQDFIPSPEPDVSMRDVSNYLITNAILFLENKGFTGAGKELQEMFPILELLSDSFWIGRDRFHGIHNIILRKARR
ncbi:hypothetical protein J7J26_03070 [Candidatus Micrarchaeota archaeon]|nr:hypothetical protein [Candidatus Micrarchaeota archaeon]